MLHIRDRADKINVVATDVSRRMTDTRTAVSDLKRRLVIALRQSVAGDRRVSDRIPCEVPVTMTVHGTPHSTTMLDLSLDGLLVDPDQLPELPEQAAAIILLRDVGRVPCVVAGTGDLGMHLAYDTLDARRSPPSWRPTTTLWWPATPASSKRRKRPRRPCRGRSKTA